MSTTEKLFTKIVIWFAGEVLLTLIGLDTVAAYGEFLLEHTASHQLQSTAADILELSLTTSTIFVPSAPTQG